MIECRLCGDKVNFIEMHLNSSHDSVTLADYTKAHPDAPLMSDRAAAMMADRMRQLSDNSKRQYDITKTFGVKFGEAKEVWGWTKPFENTPKIDEHYSFRKELLAVVLFALTVGNEPTLLTGPTGSGKSSVIEQACARLNRLVYRMNFDGDITRSDFVGQWILTGKDEMVFQYGVLPRAMREGGVLILDEWDCANPSVAMVMQSVLEDDGKLTILETGEVIEPHPDFRIFATANTVGMGDETGMYAGAQPQNYATLNRFKMVMTVDYPERKVENAILLAKTGMESCVDTDNICKKMLDVAKYIRAAFKKEETRATMSTRTLVNIAQKLLVFGDVKVAYQIAFLNTLGTEDRQFCDEIVQRVWAA